MDRRNMDDGATAQPQQSTAMASSPVAGGAAAGGGTSIEEQQLAPPEHQIEEYEPTTDFNHPVLRLECNTWNRDSHELFDYESRNVFSRGALLRRTARVFRTSADVFVLQDGQPLPPNGDYLLSIRAREGKYWVYPADRNTLIGSSQVAVRKLWLITRYLPDETYRLMEGDLMKLGRFKLRVKQIVLDNSSDVPVNYRLDDVDIPVTELTPQQAATTQCRICLLEGAEPNDPLIRACQCKGSIMYVHLECLRHWVNGRLNLSEDPARACCFIRQIPCELCKSTFPTFVTCRGVRMPIVKVPKTEPPFIVLENVVGPTNKGVHLCSLSTRKECKLGRGHESDVRIADVSISRWHATIKFVDGAFHLEDHHSKFGTLVALRKPVVIDKPDRLSVQVGRTVLKLSMIEDPPRMTQDVVTLIEGNIIPPMDSNAKDRESPNNASAQQHLRTSGVQHHPADLPPPPLPPGAGGAFQQMTDSAVGSGAGSGYGSFLGISPPSQLPPEPVVGRVFVSLAGAERAPEGVPREWENGGMSNMEGLSGGNPGIASQVGGIANWRVGNAFSRASHVTFPQSLWARDRAPEHVSPHQLMQVPQQQHSPHSQPAVVQGVHHEDPNNNNVLLGAGVPAQSALLHVRGPGVDPSRVEDHHMGSPSSGGNQSC